MIGLDFLLSISEAFLCSISAVDVKIVLPLDALQVLNLLAERSGFWNQNGFP
jgi:hypothetical protein